MSTIDTTATTATTTTTTATTISVREAHLRFYECDDKDGESIISSLETVTPSGVEVYLTAVHYAYNEGSPYLMRYSFSIAEARENHRKLLACPWEELNTFKY